MNFVVDSIDIGYGVTKGVKGLGDADRVSFPSAVGSPDQASFSLGLTGRPSHLIKPVDALIGTSAVKQSAFISEGRRDRDWVKSQTWYSLFCFAMSRLIHADNVTANLVVGLPISYYTKDRNWVRDRLEALHEIQVEGHGVQHIRINECRVVPQGWGVALDYVFEDGGRITPEALQLKIGVIDVGSCTTNLLTLDGLTEVPHQSLSVQVGAMDVLNAVQSRLDAKFPGLNMRQHKLARLVQKRSVRYDGEPHGISDVVDEVSYPLAQNVADQARGHWGDAHDIDKILIAGGGGLLLGSYLQEHFPRARVMPNGIYSNAVGMWYLGKYT